MTGRIRRSGHPGIAVLLVVGLMTALIVLTGCTRSADDKAQQLADQIYPGRLTVIETSVQPGLIGFPETWATYAVVDDPNAVVRVRPLSKDRLRQAYEEGLREGAELAALRTALEAPQLSLISVDHLTTGAAGVEGEITVASAVDAPTVVGLHDRLDTAVQRWVALRRSKDFVNRQVPVSSLQIGIMDPRAVSDLPNAPNPRWPTALQLRYDERRWAAARVRTHTAFITLTPTGRPWPTAASLRPVLTEAEQQRLDAVRPKVADWLSTRRPVLHPGPLMLAWSRLEPDSVDRLRTYALACPPSSGCTVATATHAVGVTVNLKTLSTGDYTLLPTTRRPNGGWQIPLEPERIRR